MVHKPVVYPYCHSDQVVKRGKTDTGKQRYRCHNPGCDHQSFLPDSAYKGRSPEVKEQVIEMSLNGSGIRDTARVLQISTAAVIHDMCLAVARMKCSYSSKPCWSPLASYASLPIIGECTPGIWFLRRRSLANAIRSGLNGNM
jgi:hypothetical protein